MGKEPPKRTHRTALSDAELLILDFLFDKRPATLKALSQDQYQRHMNCRYDHGLSDQALQATMRKLMELGIVVEVDGPVLGSRGFDLTLDGGQLWEEERQPDWDRYCWEEEGEDVSGQLRLRIVCKDVRIGRAFAEVGVACNLCRVDLDALVVTPEDQNLLLYWRRFNEVWSLSGPSSERDVFCDWEYYERHRTWWRGLDELDSMKS